MLPGKSMSNVQKTRKSPTRLGLTGKGLSLEFIRTIRPLTWSRISRELLWQYFLPTIYEESAVTTEPSIGQTRIFKAVEFKLLLHCSTTLDVYFMNNTVRCLLRSACSNPPNELLSRNCINYTSKFPRRTPLSKPSSRSPRMPMVSNRRWKSTCLTLLLELAFLSLHLFKRTNWQ